MVKKVDAKNAERKIQEALEILKELGFPRQQQNERSALTLLALPDLKLNDSWIEAVTSHGPVNPKRRKELKELFAGSKVGLVYVTAFLDRRTMMKYLDDISWETEVWIADSPTHLIHFNGERFLGPYED
jgi:hypothetical protein